MATGVGMGFDLSKLEKQFEKLDKQLEKLMKNGKTFEQNMNNIFNNMGQQGLTDFANRLTSLKKNVVNFGEQKVGMKWDSEGLQKYINDVNKLIYVIQHVQKETKKQGIKGVSINGLRKEVKEAQELLRLVKQAEKEASKGTQKRQQTYAGSIRYSSNVKTLEQERQAIRNLEAAREKLKKTDADYANKLRNLNDRIREHKKNIDNATNSSRNMQQSHRNLMDISGQLARKLALVFSVSQIQDYVNKLVAVRKEFELQQKSLAILIKSKDEADKLWQQTIDLAVRSPFRVKELVTYTKQLAAYRIENDKLHDTTKRLADVSAGLGVDMQRLILAFGQVKAANFLRGTELRQFTEAGIPMLEELAQYFTELEGRAISVGDTFERISKRMVSFSDVEAVFHRMTDAGGTFYNMQEEQSKTLSGMISNLHDSIDLMLNDIGKANDGILKGSVNVARTLVNNWESLVFVIKGIIIALAGYKLSQLAAKASILETAVAMNLVNGSSVKQLSMLQLLKVGWFNLGKAISITGTAMKSMIAFNLPLLAVGAIISGIWKLISAWSEHKTQLEEIGKNYDDLRKKIESINVDFSNATDEKNLDKQKTKLNELATLAERDYNMKIKVDVEGMDAEQVVNKFNEISQQVFDANIFSEHFAKMLQQSTEWVAEDDIVEDFVQLGSAANDALNELSLNRERVVFNLQKAQDSLTKLQKEAFDILKQQKSVDETNVEYLNRLKKGYGLLVGELVKYKKELSNTNFMDSQELSRISLLMKEWRKNFGDISIDTDNFSSILYNFDKYIDEAKHEFDAFIESVDVNENLTNEQKEIRLKTAIDKSAAQRGWNDFVKDYIYKWTNEKFNIQIGFVKSTPKELSNWQKEYNKFVKTLSTDAVREMDADTTTEQYLNVLRGTYESFDKDIKAWEDENAKARAQYSEEEIEAIKAQNAEREKAIKWLVHEEKKKDDTDNKELQHLKEQIRLIREASKAYEDMRKLHNKAYTDENIAKAYKSPFSEAGLGDISQYTFGTRQDELNNLNKLENTAKRVAGGMLELSKATAQVQTNLDNFNAEKANKELIDHIEEMFGNYEISLELEKLNIPPDLAKSLFNLDTLKLEELRPKALNKFGLSNMIGDTDQEVFDSEAFKSMSQDAQKAVKETLKRVSDMEDEAQLERLKKYSKFLVQAQSERVKIKVGEIQQIQEIEDTFKLNENVATSNTIGMTSAEWKAYDDLVKSGKQVNKENLKEIKLKEELIAKILEYNDQMRISVKLAKEGVKNEAQKQMDKAIWEDFKGSTMYEQLFSDLEHLGTKSIDMILDKLENMKEALKSLPPEVYKEIQSQISKLEELQIERNPFAKFIEYLKDVKKLNKETETYTNEDGENVTLKGEKAIAYRLQLAEEEAEKHRMNIELYEQIKKANGDINKLKATGIELTDEQNKLSSNTKKLDELIAEEQGEEKDAKSKAENLGLDLDKYKKARKSVDGIVSSITKWGEAFVEVLDGMDAVLDAFGVAEDDSSRLWIESTKNIANMIVQTMLLTVALTAMGVAANSALGVIGWIATALQAVAMIFASIFQQGDKRKERQIQRELELVEKLEKEYEKLEEKIENAYQFDTFEAANDEARQNLEEQIAARQRMIELEEAKKKTNKDEIKRYQDEIDELTEELKELEEERIKTLGGFGSAEEYKSATEAFVSAWLDAGLSGLEEQFDEFFANMVEKQLMMRGVDKILDPFYKQFDEMFAETSDLGGKVSDEELANIKDRWQAIAPELSDFLEELVGSLGIADDLAQSGGKLSGLQRGIQGITEDQADILAAYLNSIRLYVSQNTDYLSKIAANYDTSAENPMLPQLRIVAQQTTAINELLQSVSMNGGNGLGFRVYMP